MQLEVLIDSLRARMPWHVMRELIRLHNLENGLGWEKTIPKWVTYAERSKKDYDRLYEILLNIYEQQVLAGEKTTRFYRVTSEYIRPFCENLAVECLPETPYSSVYPLPLTNEPLAEVDTQTHLCSFSQSEPREPYIAVFCTKRTVTEKVPIRVDEYLDQLPDELGLQGYSEIVGVKTHTKQFFDVMVVDPNFESVELRLDSGHGLKSDDRSQAFRQFENTVNESISKKLAIPFSLPEPTNLFPVIDALYRSSEGRVCELAFTTEGGSVKHEKMRRKNTCLRQEAYHVGGSEAVEGCIAPYRIAATWERIMSLKVAKSEPELMLPGTARMLQAPNASLDEVVISNCASSEDYTFVINKLMALI